jgi:hypothetical protein
MKISGFSFVRNGIKLYYPITEAIRSILPICDEFVVAVGKGDEDDTTREQIAAINDPKIKIIDTEWEEKYYKKGIINSIQTDIAKTACKGDWLFYLQADEVIHEKYLPVIEKYCSLMLDDRDIEGLLFHYRHFWGDYDHYHGGHGWYQHEIRIIRNLPEIHSYQSAQSFRRFGHYDNPRQESGTHKLRVALIPAEVYHYGWVRPPHLMQNKCKALDSVHWGKKKAEDHYSRVIPEYDYGPMKLLKKFEETHPIVMKEMIDRFNWEEKLYNEGKPKLKRLPHKHERLKYRLLSFIENVLFGGQHIGGFCNYKLIKKYKN